MNLVLSPELNDEAIEGEFVMACAAFTVPSQTMGSRRVTGLRGMHADFKGGIRIIGDDNPWRRQSAHPAWNTVATLVAWFPQAAGFGLATGLDGYLGTGMVNGQTAKGCNEDA